MFCKHCGAHLDDDALFCPSCGTPVSRVTERGSLGQDDPFAGDPTIGQGTQNTAGANTDGQAYTQGQGQENGNSNNGQYSQNYGQGYNQGYSQGGYNGGGQNYYQQPQPQQPYTYYPMDKRSGGFATLCFFFPVVGLILYLIWHDTMPLRARSCGKGAIIGVIVYVVCVVLMYTIIIAASCLG